MKKNLAIGVSAIALAFSANVSAEEAQYSAKDIQNILNRLDKLEKENQQYRDKFAKIEKEQSQQKISYEAFLSKKPAAEGETSIGDVVRLNSHVTYDMLDPTTNINRKQLYLLKQKQAGKIQKDSVYLGGAVTAIADYWQSDVDSKFGYLMRHPTANNQIGETVSEAVLHSAQMNFLGTMGDWVTAYGELLYDPEQSFGSGTITDLNRNQIQLRKGYVTIGNLDESPFYLTVGKMATPFGLTDTVNPFTASTVWHAFGGLAYGALAGYSKDGLNISAELVQGGAQFRAANANIEGTNVPSQLNNFVIDANYTFDFDERGDVMLGASYQHGSAYCQAFPVTHFSGCDSVNPAWAVYGLLHVDNFTFIGEFAKTTDEWDGTFNPNAPLDIFPASDVTSFSLGAKYRASFMDRPTDFSFEFSSFIAGPDGAPWERQNQWVLGVSHFYKENVKFFAEGILVQGYVPLNFISGGNLGLGETHSVRDTENIGTVVGVNVAF